MFFGGLKSILGITSTGSGIRRIITAGLQLWHKYDKSNAPYGEELVDLGSFGSPAVYNVDLVQNGDFSAGVEFVDYPNFTDLDISQWTMGGGRATKSWDAAEFMRVTYIDDGSGSTNGSALYTSVPYIANTSYKVTMRVRGVKADGVTAQGHSFSAIANNSYLGEVVSNPTLTADYQDYEFYVVPTTATFRLYLAGAVIGDLVDFDSISIKELGEGWQVSTVGGFSFNGSGLSLDSSLIDTSGGGTGFSACSQVDSVFDVGKSYKLVIEDLDITSGSIELKFGLNHATTPARPILTSADNGTYVYYLTALVDSDSFTISSATGTVATLSSISVQEITSGGFKGWNTTPAWEVINGTATRVAIGALSHSVNVIAGNKYLVTLDVVLTTGTLSLNVGGATMQDITASGHYPLIFTATDTSPLEFADTGIVKGSIDNVSVKEIVNSVHDYSNNKNGATLYSGKALSCDGVGDYLELPAAFTETVWTCAMWLGDYTNPGSWDWLFGGVGGGTGSIGLRNHSTAKIFFKSSTGTYYDFATDTPSSYTGYKRFVFASDGTDLSLYIDGEFMSSVTPDGTTLQLLNIMSGYDSSNYLIQGKASDFQFYDACWTASDAAFDYKYPEKDVFDNVNTSILHSDCKAIYRLNEGSGSLAFNSLSFGDEEATLISTSSPTWETAQSVIPQLAMQDWSKGSNLVIFSATMTSLYASAATITASTAVQNPIGNMNTVILAPTTAAAQHYMGESSANYVGVDATAYVFSVYVKEKGTKYLQLCSSTGFSSGYANFDISVGVDSNSGTITASDLLTPVISYVGDGWYRVSGYQTTTSANARFVLSPIEAGDAARLSSSGAGTETKDLYLWGVQREIGTIAGNHIPTKGSTATNLTLPQDPNNKGYDVVGNSLKLRERGLNLDGTGYAEVYDNDSLNFGTGDFTLCCWAKYKFVNDGSGWNVLLSNGNTSNSGGSGFNLNSEATRFAVRLSDASNVATKYFNASVVEDVWYYLSVTRSGTELNTYINGGLDSTNTIVLIDVTTSSSLRVGRDSFSTRSYKEVIDESKVYNRALTLGEITKNYKAGVSKHKAGSSYSDDFSSDYGF
jgi:hypothetical protein